MRDASCRRARQHCPRVCVEAAGEAGRLGGSDKIRSLLLPFVCAVEGKLEGRAHKARQHEQQIVPLPRPRARPLRHGASVRAIVGGVYACGDGDDYAQAAVHAQLVTKKHCRKLVGTYIPTSKERSPSAAQREGEMQQGAEQMRLQEHMHLLCTGLKATLQRMKQPLEQPPYLKSNRIHSRLAMSPVLHPY